MLKQFIVIEKEGREKEIQVGGPVTIAACIATTCLAGLVSVRLSNLDEGRVFTPDQIQALVQKDAERIQNDPNIPEQAKRLALSFLQNSKLRRL